MEGVGCSAAVCRWIGQRLDDLQLLDDRAGPAVRDDDRQRILVLRAGMDEVDVRAVDLGDEIRDGIDPRFTLAPVVMRPPVVQKLLNSLERYALRIIGDGFLVG